MNRIPHSLHQRLIVPYSPKYARYQKAIRDAQVERAEKMLSYGNVKKERRNPNVQHVLLAGLLSHKRE